MIGARLGSHGQMFWVILALGILCPVVGVYLAAGNLAVIGPPELLVCDTKLWAGRIGETSSFLGQFLWAAVGSLAFWVVILCGSATAAVCWVLRYQHLRLKDLPWAPLLAVLLVSLFTLASFTEWLGVLADRVAEELTQGNQRLIQRNRDNLLATLNRLGNFPDDAQIDTMLERASFKDDNLYSVFPEGPPEPFSRASRLALSEACPIDIRIELFPQSGPDNPFPQPVMGNLEIFSPMTYPNLPAVTLLEVPVQRTVYFAGVLGEQRLAGLWLSYYLLALAPVWLFFLL